MPAEPMTFDQAQDFLRRKQPVTTTKGSRELSLDPEFPAQVRAQAFFSARVASTNVLGRLQAEVEAFTAGDVDMATARMRLKRFLASEGYQPDDVADQEDAQNELRSLENLASTRRLDLLLRQNARMAQAMGERMVSLDPDIVARWPYFRYHSRGDARAGHKALDGLVLRKDDPFWLTHTPPWEFGCRCWLEDADEDDAQAAGGVGQAKVQELPDGSQDATVRNGAVVRRVPPNKSGFVFRQRAAGPNSALPPPNFEAVKNPELKPLVVADVRRNQLAVQAESAGFGHLDGEIKRVPQKVLSELNHVPAIRQSDRSYAYYHPARRDLNLHKDGWSGQPMTFHHEMGHHIHFDRKLITPDVLDAGIKAAIDADFAHWKDLVAADNLTPEQALPPGEPTKAALVRLLKRLNIVPADAVSMEDRKRIAAYADVVAAMSRGKLGGGHEYDYYQEPWKAAAEVFAHVYAASVRRDELFLNEFPAMGKIIKEIVGYE